MKTYAPQRLCNYLIVSPFFPIINPVKLLGIGYGMWGPGKGFTSAFIDTLCIWDDEDAD